MKINAKLSLVALVITLTGVDASAGGGRITFSGALVNPSCQLNVALNPTASNALDGTVSASQCGNTPSTFTSTVSLRDGKAEIGQGIAQVTVRDSTAGPIFNISYN